MMESVTSLYREIAYRYPHYLGRCLDAPIFLTPLTYHQATSSLVSSTSATSPRRAAPPSPSWAAASPSASSSTAATWPPS